MKNCYKKSINNKHKMKIDQGIWQSRHSQLPPSKRVFAIVFLKQILNCFNFWKYSSSLKFYIMLVNTALECTDIPHRENKNQCQAARDRKILIFRILLLQSLPDTHSDRKRVKYKKSLTVLLTPSGLCGEPLFHCML